MSKSLKPEVSPSAKGTPPEQGGKTPIAAVEKTNDSVAAGRQHIGQTIDRPTEKPPATVPQESTGSVPLPEMPRPAVVGESERDPPERSNALASRDAGEIETKESRAVTESSLQSHRLPIEERSVAIVLTRPDVLAVAALSKSVVAVDENNVEKQEKIRNAFESAGADGVDLSHGTTTALDRLIEGQVPAALITIVSPAAASAFPQIAGFNVYRIPLAEN